jgi:hypothetical protein
MNSLEEASNSLKKQNFEELAVIWGKKDDDKIFALAMSPEHAINITKLTDALKTILLAIEQEFNTEGVYINSTLLTWPINPGKSQGSLNN